MAKTKISEFSATPGNNTDIDGINIAEGCAPSGINDAIRELMSQLKDFQAGTAGDSFNGPVGTTTAAAGAFTTLSASSTVSGTGFSNYLASPPAIGGTAAAAGSFTTLTTSSTVTHNGGTANGVAYLNGSKVLTTGSALTFDGTNLGVGTSSPVSATGYTGFTVRNNTNGGIIQNTDGTVDLRLQLTPATSGDIGTYSNHPVRFVLNGSEQMRLTSTGLVINDSARIGSARFSMQVNASTENAIAFKTSTNGEISALRGLNSAGSETVALNYDTTNSALYFRTANTQRMTLDSSGNLGLGVTPSASASVDCKQIAFGGLNYLSGTNGTSGKQNFHTGLLYNAYQTGAANWNAIVSNSSSDFLPAAYTMVAGQHQWRVASSATAGSAITFTQAMTLDASGNLGIGATSPSYRLEVRDTADAVIALVKTGANSLRFLSTSSGGVINQVDNNPLAFYTNSTERARITSGGYFKASNTGTYQSSTSTYHELRSDANANTVRISNTIASGYTDAVAQIAITGYSPNTTNSWFLFCNDSVATRAEIRSNGGIANYSANDVNLSDRREKTNFAPAKSYLDTICAIPVQTFNYIDQNLEEDPGLTLGVVAQDVQAVAPELVMESNWGTKDEPKMRLSIYQTDLQYALMKALQELKAEFDAYKATHP